MRLLHCLLQRVKIKIFCCGTHAVFLRADIDGICAELQRGCKAFGIAGGREQLRLNPRHLLPPVPLRTAH